MNLLDLTVTEAADLIKRRAIAPSELVGACLDGITAVEPTVKAFVEVYYDEALRTAVELDDTKWDPARPLLGIPVGVKDIFDIEGKPTRCGSRALGDNPAPQDADVVSRLRSSGAVIVGKTVMHECAYGIYSPPCRNPWDPARIPGGSSGGSAAAVAARECFAALGTDTGGSVRIPAALNGVVGLKPTYDRLSRRGVVPLSWSLDHCGLITRSVEDAALMFRSMLDPRGPTEQSIVPGSVAGLRVGVLDELCFPVQSAVATALDSFIDVMTREGVTFIKSSAPTMRYSIATELGIVHPEASAFHERNLRNRAHLYGDDVRQLLFLGLISPASHYLQAQRVRAIMTEELKALFRDARLDAVVGPSVPAVAINADQALVQYATGSTEYAHDAYVRTSAPFNLTGMPAISVPAGFAADGMPVGIQLGAPPFQEATLFRIGRHYQRLTDWHTRRPEVAASDRNPRQRP